MKRAWLLLIIVVAGFFLSRIYLDLVSSEKPSLAETPEAVAEEQARQAELHKRAIYDEKADARAEIAAACERARKFNKRVLIMYGGNWCVWCHRLNYVLETDPRLSKALHDHFELVHVDIRSNRPIAAEYQVEDQGVPYLTVLSPDNQVIHNQETGSLEVGKGYDIAKVLALLMKWRCGRPPDASGG